MSMNYQFYLVRDPAICGGETVIRGTRVTLRTVLASLAEGMTAAEILQDFPTLDEKAIRAVIAFAAVSAEEDLPLPSVEHHPLPQIGCHAVEFLAMLYNKNYASMKKFLIHTG